MKTPPARKLSPPSFAIAAVALALGLISSALNSSGAAAAANSHIGPGVKHMLYVTDDHAKNIKIYDIDRNHELVRTLKLPELEDDLEAYRKNRMANAPAARGPATKKGGRGRPDPSAPVEANIRGVTADANSGWLWFSEDKVNKLYAYDFVNEKMAWTIDLGKYEGARFPDRINVTRDGKALYVPVKNNDRMLVLDSRTGAKLADHPMHTNPHNTFIGEQGKYVFAGGRSGGPMYIFDQQTHKLVKTIGPFSGPIRPLTADPTESYFFANITKLEGIGVGEVATGKIWEVLHRVPAEREKYPQAKTDPMPHGNQPIHHGIAVRPGSKKEVWTIDDGWGYLYVFDYSTMPPKWVKNIPLFDDITKVVVPARDRWIQFSNDGKYCYTPSRVIDADTGKVIATHIAVSEKIVEIDFRDGVPIVVSGQNGGVYPAGNTRTLTRN
jgi:DNA-binding beta-propeller fold protein YncE